MLACGHSFGMLPVLTMESHDPVHNDIASLLTPRQLTRLSWP